MAAGLTSHNWPDDLIDIVNEPMGQTLDRMRKYSTSLSRVDRGMLSLDPALPFEY